MDCTLKLRYASDRRHLDEMLHAIVAQAKDLDLSYEITDSPQAGPLGLPLWTCVGFSARRGTSDALEAEIGDAIGRAGLADRFQALA